MRQRAPGPRKRHQLCLPGSSKRCDWYRLIWPVLALLHGRRRVTTFLLRYFAAKQGSSRQHRLTGRYRRQPGRPLLKLRLAGLPWHCQRPKLWRQRRRSRAQPQRLRRTWPIMYPHWPAHLQTGSLCQPPARLPMARPGHHLPLQMPWLQRLALPGQTMFVVRPAMCRHLKLLRVPQQHSALPQRQTPADRRCRLPNRPPPQTRRARFHGWHPVHRTTPMARGRQTPQGLWLLAAPQPSRTAPRR